MKKSNIVIFVYDITNKKSFNELKKYWYNEVKSYLGKEVVYAVAGNKSDLYEDQVISANEGKEFADSFNGIFKETTATDYEVISELFYLAAEECLKKKKKENEINDDNNGGYSDSNKNDSEGVNLNDGKKNNNRSWC